MARTERATRTPLSTRSILEVKGQEAGYTYRVVNDVGDRIDTFKEAGYGVVTDPNVTIGDRRVTNPSKEGSAVTTSVGGGVKGVLMRIKDEWYKEDQKAKQRTVDELEAATNKNSSTDYGSVKIT